jgi:hypothetical protein
MVTSFDHYTRLVCAGFENLLYAIEERGRENCIEPARRFSGLESENATRRTIRQQNAQVLGKNQQAYRNGRNNILVVAALGFDERQQPRYFPSSPLIQVSSLHAIPSNSLNCIGHFRQGTLGYGRTAKYRPSSRVWFQHFRAREVIEPIKRIVASCVARASIGRENEAMRSIRPRWPAPLLTLLFLAACSEPPKSAEQKAPPKPPEALTGRQAFQRTYPQARTWAMDAQPLEIRSVNLAQVKAEKGKAGAWQVTFVSPSLAKEKMYTYSAVEGDGNLHEGVFAGPEESYSGRGDSSPILLAAIKVDSDEAYRTAAEKSAEYIEKNPNKPVMYLMALTRRFPDPTWRVIWGDSVGTSDYSAFVDATTGKLLQIMH